MATDIEITDEYRVVHALLSDDLPVVFVSGNAGTGKSTLIRYLRDALAKKLVVVAPTGVAALNVEGATIHSFFRLPPKIHEEEDIKLVLDRQMYRELELLIIDEVSMVRADLMDSMDRFLRKNRLNNAPFGGVQLLLVGDLFQLPPVVPRQEWEVLTEKGYSGPYFFHSFKLQNVSLIHYELTSFFRQTDQAFIELLNKVRTGDDLDYVVAELNQRCTKKDTSPSDITLTCTNSVAEQINRTQLERIRSREYVREGHVDGRFAVDRDRLPSPMDLRLKVDARVMFTKNDELQQWVNGSLGIVRAIDGQTIVVELIGDQAGLICEVTPATWETYTYSYDAKRDRIVAETAGTYTQYPLMLAWAITIHKSQGQSLDNVLVDLGTGAFAYGQVYVALSRCRSIEGIHLARPIRKADIRCDPSIKEFYLTQF